MLNSISSADGMFCVDFFRRPRSGFGFEHFRADPEDAGRWTVVGGFGSGHYTQAFDAATAAADSVGWLTTEPAARRAWEDWCGRCHSFGRRAVVFDLDGVIRHFDPDHGPGIERRHGLAPGRVASVAFAPELLTSLVTGEMSRREWTDAIGQRLGVQAAAAEFTDTLGTVDRPMIGFVAELRAGGVVAAILTNGCDTTGDELATLGIAGEFDMIFNSAEIGRAKPDPEVYRHVLARLDLAPEQVFFTDDRLDNTEAASRLGIRSHHFVGPPSDALDHLRAAVTDWWTGTATPSSGTSTAHRSAPHPLHTCTPMQQPDRRAGRQT